MLCLRQIATSGVISERSIDLISAILTKFDDILTTAETETTTMCFLMKASRLIQLSLASGDRTTSSILIILSSAYLRRMKQCVAERDKDDIYYLVNIHLALLSYITEHYRSAVRRSKQVILHSPKAVENFCSLNFDNNIGTVLGLVTLYQHA